MPRGARLHEPAGEDGSNTGGTDTSATEQFLDSLGGEPSSSSSEQPAADAAAPGDDEQRDADNASATPQASDTQVPGKRAAAFLDAPTAGAKPAEPKADDKAATEGAKPGEQQPKDGKADKPKANEDELLAGVKSERGRERIRKVFEKSKRL